MTEFEAATLAYQYAGLWVASSVGVAQCLLIGLGLWYMRRASDHRNTQHAEFMAAHAETAAHRNRDRPATATRRHHDGAHGRDCRTETAGRSAPRRHRTHRASGKELTSEKFPHLPSDTSLRVCAHDSSPTALLGEGLILHRDSLQESYGEAPKTSCGEGRGGVRGAGRGWRGCIRLRVMLPAGDTSAPFCSLRRRRLRSSS